MRKKERMFLVFWVLLSGIVIGLFSYGIYKQDKDIMEKVLTEEVILMCHMKDGYKRIAPSKVEGYSEGRWYFTNGSATRCNTYKQ